MVPVGSLSPGGQKIAHFFPCMFFTRIVEGVFLKGTGFAELWPNVLILMLFSVVFLTSVICDFIRGRIHDAGRCREKLAAPSLAS